MSAEWDCQRHNTTNIGACALCDIEEEVHGLCNSHIADLSAQLKIAREALQQISHLFDGDIARDIAKEALREMGEK